MTRIPTNNKFEEWLLENHNRTIESLTWQEYNKYQIMFSNETFFERLIKPNLEKELIWV